MNDLRSRSLSAVPDGENGDGVRSTPPRIRPSESERPSNNAKMSRRQSIEERARQDVAARSGQRIKAGSVDSGSVDSGSVDSGSTESNGSSSKSKSAAAQNGSRPEGGNRSSRRRAQSKNGPQSRPSRRRENEDEEVEGDKFPWHFEFDNDEPEELQASSPLLSRAFRASIG